MDKTRIVGQTRDVGFEVGVRKTLPVSVGKAWEFLFSIAGLSIWLGKIPPGTFELGKSFETEEGIKGEISIMKISSHIRMKYKPKHWPNTSTLQIRVIESNGKATISFHQEKLLGTEQREEMKMHWDNVLEKITKSLL
jgi:hypothetical protein